MRRFTTGLLAVLAVAVVGLVVALMLVHQQLQEQDRELSRLQACVAVLERNQATPVDQPMMSCPIYN